MHLHDGAQRARAEALWFATTVSLCGELGLWRARVADNNAALLVSAELVLYHGDRASVLKEKATLGLAQAVLLENAKGLDRVV